MVIMLQYIETLAATVHRFILNKLDRIDKECLLYKKPDDFNVLLLVLYLPGYQCLLAS